MRNIIIYHLLFSVVLLLVACGGGDDAGGNNPSSGSEYLNVNNVEAAGDQTSVILNIEASQNCEWSITWNESWIRSVSPAKGRGKGSATITCDVNPSSSTSRKAILTVSNANSSIVRTVTLTQAANAESITLSISELNFSYTEETRQITLTSNTHWTVTGKEDWLTINPMEGDNTTGISITTKENATENVREALLTFTGTGGASAKLKITQSPVEPTLTVSPTTINAEATGKSYELTLESNIAWTAQSNQNWAKLDVTSGKAHENQKVIVTLDDNTTSEIRNAEIMFTYSTKQATVSITQAVGTKPSVMNVQVQQVSGTTATITFSYTSLSVVTEYGLCYSDQPNPSAENGTLVSAKGTEKEGTVTLTLTGLAVTTTYYVRAYATNVLGTTYSNSVEFQTEKPIPSGGDNVTPDV